MAMEKWNHSLAITDFSVKTATNFATKGRKILTGYVCIQSDFKMTFSALGRTIMPSAKASGRIDNLTQKFSLLLWQGCGNLPCMQR